MDVPLEVACEDEKVGLTFRLGVLTLLPAESRAMGQNIELQEAIIDITTMPLGDIETLCFFW